MLGLQEADPVTLGLDSINTVVPGVHKEDATYNYERKLSFGALFCTWSEWRRVRAADLRPEHVSERPLAARLVVRALPTLPARHGRCACERTVASTPWGFSTGVARTTLATPTPVA
jgi:hypothetical protein